MTILLVGVGIIFSIRFSFRYQWKIAFNFKNTFAKIGAKGEGEGTVSGFRAACTALANTVGTGNISGVATAIVSGGPGALVWMWVSAFFGMSTKACEIILGQRYREHYKKSMNEYVCDRSFVLKNAFGWKKGAVGGKLTAIAIAVFAWTTIIGMYYTCEKSVNYAFGDTERNRKMMPIYIVYFMLPCVIFYNIESEALWAFTDILSALYVCITVFIIVAKRKEIFRLFDDFWNRYLPAKEAGENPPYVTFDCKEQD